MYDPFSTAIEQLNAINAEDPNGLEVDREPRPRELAAAERLEAWVLKANPDASEALRLASRCQHLKRWAFRRSEYPEGRVGYLKWRKDLSKKHAGLAAEAFERAGISEEVRAQVRAINLKDRLKTNPGSQTMENALCLSFLEHEFAEFAAKHEDEKVVDIVQKTWRKMSERGHELALQLPLSGRAQILVGRALSGD
ncbi:MAG: DUF4202 domain-containing protein [Polyangiales bacterium]